MTIYEKKSIFRKNLVKTTHEEVYQGEMNKNKKKSTNFILTYF